MSSLLVANSRAGGAGQLLPGEAVQRRSERIMHRQFKQEHAHIDHCLDRIDLEVKAREALSRHIEQKDHQQRKQHAQVINWNDRWAVRSHEAMVWRKQKEWEKLANHSTNLARKSQRLDDFNSWKQRVLVDAPRQCLDHRSRSLSDLQSASNDEIDRYMRFRLGPSRPSFAFSESEMRLM